MLNWVFLSGLGLGLGLLFWWGFRHLTGERFQVLVAVPSKCLGDGRWEGPVVTFYGLIVALAGVLCMMLVVVLLGSVGVTPAGSLLFAAAVLGVALPAAGRVAAIVEKRKHTLTVSGAIQAALFAAPLLILGLNGVLGTVSGITLPMVPALAVLAVSWTIGEGVGRLACVSFGCCYGKPVERMGGGLQTVFRCFHFRFHEATRKASYEGGFSGVALVPIQAINSIVLTATGMIGIGLFLSSRFELSFAVTAMVSFAWRILSEAARADYRGAGRLTSYQKMSLVGIFYSLLLVKWAGIASPATPSPDLGLGLWGLWRPETVVSLQVLGVLLLLATGRSKVIDSRLSLHLKAGVNPSSSPTGNECLEPAVPVRKAG